MQMTSQPRLNLRPKLPQQSRESLPELPTRRRSSTLSPSRDRISSQTFKESVPTSERLKARLTSLVYELSHGRPSQSVRSEPEDDLVLVALYVGVMTWVVVTLWN